MVEAAGATPGLFAGHLSPGSPGTGIPEDLSPPSVAAMGLLSGSAQGPHSSQDGATNDPRLPLGNLMSVTDDVPVGISTLSVWAMAALGEPLQP